MFTSAVKRHWERYFSLNAQRIPVISVKLTSRINVSVVTPVTTLVTATSSMTEERVQILLLPSELLHDIIAHPLSWYLHKMLSESPTGLATHPGWKGLRNLLRASSLLRAITTRMLQEAFHFEVDDKDKYVLNTKSIP